MIHPIPKRVKSSFILRNRFKPGRFGGGIPGFLVTTLVALIIADAHAFPVFCTDFKELPARVLTGCEPGALLSAPPWLEDARIATQVEKVFPTTPLLAPSSQRRPLLHVGPRAVSPDERTDDEGGTALPADNERPSRSAGEAESQEQASGLRALIRDEGWYRMYLDEDGTYLFFGEMDEAPDDPTIDEDDEDLLPEGIGIGKKWRF